MRKLLLLVPILVVLGGCGSPDDCTQPGQGEFRLLQALFCYGYTPPTLHPIIDVSSIPVFSGDTVSFDGERSYISGNTSGEGDLIVRATWDFGDGSPVQVADLPVSYTVFHRYSVVRTTQITVRLVIEDSWGATAEASRVLTINPMAAGPSRLPVSLTVTPNPTVPEQPTSFVASDVPGDPTSYRWDFGDGTSLTTSYQSALYSYTCFGTVTATVTVTDSAGATGSATQQVTVTPEQGFPACAPRAARDAHAPLGLFAARFTHARVIRIAGLTRARGVTTVHGLVMAGRLEGQLFGSRAPGSAAAARWTALLTLVEDPARRTAILRGFALARLGRGGGTACLRVNLTRHGNGVARGSFAVLGGTGMLARVSGGGSFAYLLGRDLTGRLAGRLHVGRARPRLRPPACRALRALPDRP